MSYQGLLGDAGTVPAINLPTLPPFSAVPVPQPTAQPMAAPVTAQPQETYPGLKKPPPPIGTIVNGFAYVGGDPRSTAETVWKPVHGDEYLSSLPIDDDKRTLIKMMANYEAPASGARGVGTPEVQQLIGFAKKYDPTFDIKNYKVRQDYLHDLNDQKANGTIQALSNAALHAKAYDDEFQKLGNSDSSYEWWNAAKQNLAGTPLIGGLFGGSDRLKASGAAKTDATILGPEIARVAQGGPPTVDEVNRQVENLGAASWTGHGIGVRPSTEAGVVSAMAQKIGDRMLSMQAQYRRAFGDMPPKEPLLTPEAALAAHQLLKRYAPDYENKLDFKMLTAGGFSPQQAKGMTTQTPATDPTPRNQSGPTVSNW